MSVLAKLQLHSESDSQPVLLLVGTALTKLRLHSESDSQHDQNTPLFAEQSYDYILKAIHNQSIKRSFEGMAKLQLPLSTLLVS